MNKNENIIHGKTKSGIEFTLDKRVKEDTRLLLWLTNLQDEKKSALQKSDALFALLSFLFGSEEALAIFMDEVAAHHEGVADVKSLLAELSDMLEALDIKNS